MKKRDLTVFQVGCRHRTKAFVKPKLTTQRNYYTTAAFGIKHLQKFCIEHTVIALYNAESVKFPLGKFKLVLTAKIQFKTKLQTLAGHNGKDFSEDPQQ